MTYRIKVTEISTGANIVKSFRRASIAHGNVEKVNQEWQGTYSAVYLGRKGSKTDMPPTDAARRLMEAAS